MNSDINISILITGEVGTGKTSLAVIIKELLEKEINNIDVEIDDDLDGCSYEEIRWKAFYNMEKVGARVKINTKVKTVRRNPFERQSDSNGI